MNERKKKKTEAKKSHSHFSPSPRQQAAATTGCCGGCGPEDPRQRLRLFLLEPSASASFSDGE